MNKTIILATSLAFALSACGSGIEDAVTGEEIYASCISCHGAQGEKPPLGMANAIIAGQSEEELVKKLQGYKNGSYGGMKRSSMARFAVNMTDEQTATVSKYISEM